MTINTNNTTAACSGGELRGVLARFYKTVDVMKSARNSPTHSMCVWADDMKAVEDVMLFLERLRDASPLASNPLEGKGIQSNTEQASSGLRSTKQREG